MKLQMTKRSNQPKKEAKRLRRDGNIPAIVYQRGKEAESIAIKYSEFDAIIRKMTKGRLPTTQLTLVNEDGKEIQAIVKDIQYHPTTYAVQHLDFEELEPGFPVNIKVPIECSGVVDCVGVKQGGVLRTVLRHVKVRCLPKDIPDSFIVDVTDLEMMQSKRLKNVAIPETIRVLTDRNEVAVIVAKR